MNIDGIDAFGDFEVMLSVSDCPVMSDRYDKEIRFVPSTLRLRYSIRMGEDGNKWVCRGGTILGFRIRRNGTRGKRAVEYPFFDFTGEMWPDWVQSQVDLYKPVTAWTQALTELRHG